uniref:hypothetical protein n=1 Tax=Accumulibacter sp. TaxID=2053492 RepID=UPI0026228F5A
RHVLVHVILGGVFPPEPNSAKDVALLRAANRAMCRKQRGSSDAFLFVLAGNHDTEKIQQAIAAYGFPNFAGEVDAIDDIEDQLETNYDDICSLAGHTIFKWLNREHPGAIACFSLEYRNTEFWWEGVEHEEDVFDWPFSPDAYAASLPYVHRTRAATWMTVLGHAVDLHETQATFPDALASAHATAWAATLSEWLHGFEAASGNSYNNFESEFAPELMPSEFFLGFEFARISGEDLELVCERTGDDIDSLGSVALKAVTEERRSEFRGALSSFFGGDSGLFWALHSAIWPKFDKPMSDALNDLLGVADHDGLADLDAPWRFVSEGWCDEADG